MIPRIYIPPDHLQGLLVYTDWSEFVGYAMGTQFAEYARLLDAPVPVLANVNPPSDASWGVDAWCSRVQPATWGPVLYGYTNWIGLAMEDSSALSCYMVLTRRQKGPNIEENWGFTDPYGAPYAFANVCSQQTLIALAGGATGYKVYTAVGTASWNGDLDRFHTRPYPSHPPIAADGTVTPKAAVLALLGRFLARHGAEFALCHSAAAVTWGRSYCACEPGKAECGAYQGL